MPSDLHHRLLRALQLSRLLLLAYQISFSMVTVLILYCGSLRAQPLRPVKNDFLHPRLLAHASASSTSDCLYLPAAATMCSAIPARTSTTSVTSQNDPSRQSCARSSRQFSIHALASAASDSAAAGASAATAASGTVCGR